MLNEDTDNEDVIMLPENLFIKLMDMELQEELIRTTTKDDFFTKAMIAIKDHGTPPIKSNLVD